MFEETREYLKKIGMPTGDLFDMPTSTARFPDGGAYRIEVPTVNSAEAVGALLDTATKNGITINRVTETYGMFRHTRQEMKEYCRLCSRVWRRTAAVGRAACHVRHRRHRAFAAGRAHQLPPARHGAGSARAWKTSSAATTSAAAAS